VLAAGERRTVDDALLSFTSMKSVEEYLAEVAPDRRFRPKMMGEGWLLAGMRGWGCGYGARFPHA
jgi:hypothetical protein